MFITIKFLGGAGTVTGSSHLITAGKSRVLLDAGLFQGRRDEFYDINTNLHYNPRTLDALVLSHAHIDHCGNIPSLIKQGMRCKIFATSATKDLARLMLEDSGKIQEEDIKYVNKVNKRLGARLRKPLYTKRDAQKASRKFSSVAYGRKFYAAKNIFVALYDAGHILGSGIIVLDIIVLDIKEGKSNIRLAYAVDLGRKNLPLLNDPVTPEGIDYLIIETTYGGRFHTPIEEAKIKLKDSINRTINRGGKIIIPSFTLERTQEVIYFLNKLLREKAIPNISIYLDSPLAIDITEVFKSHVDFLDKENQRAVKEGNSPFEFLNLKYVRSQEESKALNNDKRAMIIIAGSGMCESGRILHHLKNNIEDSRNTVLVVGYMAKDTLGKRIVDKQHFVRIFGMEYELNAEVVTINAFSGHADQNELYDYICGCLPLKRIFLVHGESDQAQALSVRLTQNKLDVYIPNKDEEMELV